MAKMRRKADLPTKLCVTCNRPFAWRKKWQAHWDEVKYCSQRCRQSAPSVKQEKIKAAVRDYKTSHNRQ